jgi:hypothetical protein
LTFHAACAWILRRDSQALGYTPTFTIYDIADSRRAIRRFLGTATGEDSEQGGGGAGGARRDLRRQEPAAQRLCYVGITRAQTELHITHAHKRVLYGKVTSRQQSRFLDELKQASSEQHTDPARTTTSGRRSHRQSAPTLRSSASPPHAIRRTARTPWRPVRPAHQRARDHCVGRQSRGASKPGAATIMAADGPAVTAVFDREPGQAVRHARPPGAPAADQLKPKPVSARICTGRALARRDNPGRFGCWAPHY